MCFTFVSLNIRHSLGNLLAKQTGPAAVLEIKEIGEMEETEETEEPEPQPVALYFDIAPKSPAVARVESPCFVEATSVDFSAGSRDALIEAQRVLIEKYCILMLQGVFRTSAVDPPSLVCNEPNSHPIQDPSGALFLALLVVRRNRPKLESFMDPPHEKRLRRYYRFDMAALISVCQKLCTSTMVLKLEQFLQYLYTQFLYENELPNFRRDSQIICAEFYATELLFLREPLHALFVDNPQTLAETLIGDLHKRGKISMLTCKVMRGSTFFLLGSCLLNRKEDVLEVLSARYGNMVIAKACVTLLLILMATRGLPLDGAELEDLEREALPLLDHITDSVACVILRNCIGKYANQLRIGPYRSQMFAGEKPHLVQRLVKPDNLQKGLALLLDRVSLTRPMTSKNKGRSKEVAEWDALALTELT